LLKTSVTSLYGTEAMGQFAARALRSLDVILVALLFTAFS
jgi:hypothetical protein